MISIDSNSLSSLNVAFTSGMQAKKRKKLPIMEVSVARLNSSNNNLNSLKVLQKSLGIMDTKDTLRVLTCSKLFTTE